MNPHFFAPREITLEKRNNTFFYVLLLSLPTFLVIGIVFLVLYLLQVPITINGNARTFADPEYQSFFRLFAFVLFLPLLALIPIYWIYRIRAVDTQIFLATDDDLEPFLYVEEKRKIVYVDAQRLVTLTKKTDQVTVVTDPLEIAAEKTKYLFWSDMENQERFKIKEKRNGFKVSYLVKGNRGMRAHVFTIRTDVMGKIEDYRERISSRSGTRNSTQGFYSYRRLETKKPRLDARIRQTLGST
jgi:hypothetical protein